MKLFVLVIALVLKPAIPSEQSRQKHNRTISESPGVGLATASYNTYHAQQKEAEISTDQYYPKEINAIAKQFPRNVSKEHVKEEQIIKTLKSPQSSAPLDTYTEKEPRPPEVFSFNLTEAVRIGIRFHDLHCPKSCDADGNVVLKKCSRTRPSCPMCRCDADCVKYGDCCNHLRPKSVLIAPHQEGYSPKTNLSLDEFGKGMRGSDMHRTESKITEAYTQIKNLSSTNMRSKDHDSAAMSDTVQAETEVDCESCEAVRSYFRCFAIEKWKTVYIVAKCPLNQRCSHTLQNNDTQKSQASGGNTACSGETTSASIRDLCDNCLSNADMISLVTSHLTGDTYCNEYCLQCHENRPLNSSDLKWQPEESCRSVPIVVPQVIKNTFERVKSCIGEIMHQHQNTLTSDKNVSNSLPNFEKGFEKDTKKSESDFITQKRDNVNTSKSLETRKALIASTQNKKCSTETPKTPERKIRMETKCHTRYLAPPSVSLQKCDYRLKDPVVGTCNLTATRQFFQDAENETLLELERLCMDHYAPVYDQRNVYKNIFCFICQGQKPTMCNQVRQNYEPEAKNPFIEVNLALLTDLGGRISGDAHRKSEEETSIDLTNENSTFPCEEGYWEDTITGRCRRINCSPGRMLSVDESQCLVATQVKDEADRNKAGNIVGPEERNVFVLNLLWRRRSHESLLKPSLRIDTDIIEQDDRANFETIGSIESHNGEYIAVRTNFDRSKNGGFKTLQIRNRPKRGNFRRSVIQVDKDGVVLDSQTGDTINKRALIPDNKNIEEEEEKEEARTYITQNIMAKETEFLKSEYEFSKCLSQFQVINDLDCSAEVYPETCEGPGSDSSDCWLRILRKALSSFKLGASDLGEYHQNSDSGDGKTFTILHSEQKRQKYGENGLKKPKKLLEDVHVYIASVMKQLGITTYLLLKSNSIQTSDSIENFVSNESPGLVDEMYSILYFQTTFKKNRTALEQKLVHYFNGEHFIEGNASSLSVIMMTSNPDISFTDYSLSIGTTPREICSKFNPLSGLSSMDALISFHRLACNPSEQNFTSKNIIGIDLTTTCPFVSFKASDFNVSDSGNSSLVLVNRNRSSLVIPRFNYTLDGDLVHICVKTLAALLNRAKTPIQRSVLAQMENILTVLSLFVSLVSLLALFLTYSMFPSLRSLPGKNNMVLVFWLFVAQLQLCLEPLWRPFHNTCVLMGLLLHLSWLYTMAWTTACSFHMCRIFAACRGVALKHSTNHRFYLSRYLTACFIFSFGLVIAVITGTGVSSEWTQVGYGGRGVCYLSSTLLVLLAFALPLALTLIVNCALFSFTVWSISRVDAIQRQAGRERRNAHVYLRLSSLTGLCWTLALLAEIPGLSVLRCVSVVVNGSQGLLLFLSYACNRRVYRLWSNVLLSKGGRSPHKDRGANLRAHKQVGREGSSSRRTGSTIVAGLL